MEKCFLSFSVGAPLGTQEMRQRFARAYAAGLLLGGSLQEEMDPSELVELFASAWTDSEDLALADEKSLRVHVRHEAQLVTYPLTQLLSAGKTFMIADIGATTTEVAIFRQGPHELQRWASQSLPIGVDQSDLARLEETNDDTDLLQLRIRRREGAAAGDGLGALLPALEKQVRAVVTKAVNLNPDERSWTEMNVALAGGGSNLKAVRDVFSGGPAPHPFVRTRLLHSLTPPEVEVVGASNLGPASSESPEIMCVLGAAYPPDEDQPYSSDELEMVIPIHEDPIAERRRALASQWL
jgi:hypothetical protein